MGRRVASAGGGPSPHRPLRVHDGGGAAGRGPGGRAGDVQPVRPQPAAEPGVSWWRPGCTRPSGSSGSGGSTTRPVCPAGPGRRRSTRRFLDWLREVRFTGRVRAVPEGRIVFADEPLLEVDGRSALPSCSRRSCSTCFTFPTAVTTKAARCREAAQGRTGPGRLRPPAGPRRRRRDDGRPGGGHRRVRRHLQRGRRRPLRPSGQRHHGPLLSSRRWPAATPAGRARRLPVVRRALPRRPRPPGRHLGHRRRASTTPS